MKKLIFAALMAALISITTTTAHAATTYDFTAATGSFSGSGCANATDGSGCANGNVFTQNLGGLILNGGTAWHVNAGNFAASQLFKSGPPAPFIGLGVCSPGEGTHTTPLSTCDNQEGYLDTVGPDEYILFNFNQAVDFISYGINPDIHNGTGTQFWLGNWTTLTGLSLASLGSPNGTSSADSVNVPGTTPYSAIIIGARGINAGVKLENLTVNASAVPEPGSMALLGAGLLVLGILARSPSKQ